MGVIFVSDLQFSAETNLASFFIFFFFIQIYADRIF